MLTYALTPPYSPPEAVLIKVTLSVFQSTSWSTVTVTVCGSLQRFVVPVGLNVRRVLSNVRSVNDVPVIVIDTLPEGCEDSLTVEEPLLPSAISNVETDVNTFLGVASQVAIAETADVGPVLAPSDAASAATVTTTSAEPFGVTTSV